MGFEEAQAHLQSLGIDVMKTMGPSLHRIEALLEALDHPEQRVPAIHIAGTNGKTSTARIATSLLAATGLSVGTYTSPHLETVRERISMSGTPLSADQFGDVFDHIRPYLTVVEERLGEPLSYFELLTGMFYLWAAEAPVDAMVVEVGLGGRWDATNVIDAPVAVVTNIGLDHTQLLGSERTVIAREKAGIIKQNAEVVSGELSPDVLRVITEEADAQVARTAVFQRDFSVASSAVAVGGRYVSLRTSRRSYDGLFLPLHGAHQSVNAAVALEAVTKFLPAHELGEDVVAEGLAGAIVPGRAETISAPGETRVVLDVAHNPEGMSALVKTLAESFGFTQVVFVLGTMADKDFNGMLTELTRVPGTILLTEARGMRAVPVSELAEAAKRLALDHEEVEGVPAAVSRALDLAGENDLVCITGSHYVVGEARTYLTS